MSDRISLWWMSRPIIAVAAMWSPKISPQADDAARGHYRVRVVHAVAGGEPAAELQLDVDGLLSRRDALEAVVPASSVSGRRVVPEDVRSV